MPSFLHGVAVAEINQGINKVKTSSSSVIGVIGTAPEATEDFPLNTPVLIAGSYTEAAKLGTAGTLPTALEGILAQTGAMVVVVRIAEGVASGEGNDAITAAEATINNVIGSVSADGTYSGVYSFLASKSILGVTPRILCAPGFSVKEVVTELNTIYIKGTDYKLTAGQVDWSLSGAEPSPGSSYEIIYRHRTQVTPTNITDTSIDISRAVDGSMVLVTYTWKMPRYDLITIDAEGIVRRVKGLAHPWSPVVPKAPNGQFILAVIKQTWETDSVPDVTNSAIRVTGMSEIATMKKMIEDLYYLIAQERLKSDANASDPSAKKGIFVDPFFDDDMRDQGIEQTAAIVDGKLQLPIDFSVTDFAKDEKVYMLPYTLEAVVSQTMLTGYMKVNPYNAFEPIPADLEITLNVDHWVDQVTQWTSPVTQSYWEHVSYATLKSMVGGGPIVTGMNGTTVNSVSTTSQVVGSSKQAAKYMRQVDQKFSIDGFKAGENIRTVTFAGKSITARSV